MGLKSEYFIVTLNDSIATSFFYLALAKGSVQDKFNSLSYVSFNCK